MPGDTTWGASQVAGGRFRRIRVEAGRCPLPTSGRHQPTSPRHISRRRYRCQPNKKPGRRRDVICSANDNILQVISKFRGSIACRQLYLQRAGESLQSQEIPRNRAVLTTTHGWRDTTTVHHHFHPRNVWQKYGIPVFQQRQLETKMSASATL